MWNKEWPKEPGWYWCYGYEFRDEGKPPYLFPVEVHIDGIGHLMYITKGHFLYKAEGATGVWQKMELPKLPVMGNKDLEEVVPMVKSYYGFYMKEKRDK